MTPPVHGSQPCHGEGVHVTQWSHEPCWAGPLKTDGSQRTVLTKCDPLEEGTANHSSTGFPYSSVGKESTCNAGDPSSIRGSGRSPGEGIGYLLQYSWSSLVVQTIKNLPERQETWVWSLSWEYPLEEGMATHSSILAWRIPMGRGAWWATVHGVTKESDKTEQLSTAQHVVSGVRQRENRETKIALPWTNIKNNLLVLILL